MFSRGRGARACLRALRVTRDLCVRLYTRWNLYARCTPSVRDTSLSEKRLPTCRVSYFRSPKENLRGWDSYPTTGMDSGYWRPAVVLDRWLSIFFLSSKNITPIASIMYSLNWAWKHWDLTRSNIWLRVLLSRFVHFHIVYSSQNEMAFFKCTLLCAVTLHSKGI